MMEVAPKHKRNQLENVDPSQQLVEQASAGCSDSFHQLVEQNHRRVRLYLGRYVKCSAQVDDIAQDVFLVAFCRLKEFRHEAKFSTWLIGIARNKALEFLKAETKGRKGRKELFDSEIAARQIARLEDQQEQNELVEQRLTAMQLCLDQLPTKSRELIEQYYFEERPATSIAATSKVSTGSVRMRLLRIRQVLQKCIKARSHGPDDKHSVFEFNNE